MYVMYACMYVAQYGLTAGGKMLLEMVTVCQLVEIFTTLCIQQDTARFSTNSQQIASGTCHETNSVSPFHRTKKRGYTTIEAQIADFIPSNYVFYIPFPLSLTLFL
jgi:hypothetical protein